MPILLSPTLGDHKFETSHGVAQVIYLKGLDIGRIRLGAVGDKLRWPDNAATEFKAILTNWQLVERVLAQIEPSLDDDVYIWSLGDAHDDLTIEGLAVQMTCSPQDQSKHGFEHVLEFYRKNRLSARDTSLVIQLGGVTIESRLLAIRLTGQPNSNLVGFSMSFAGAPPERVRKRNLQSV